MLLRAGTTLNERYEILSTVGAGGMADVYRARDRVLKRLVAIKVLKEEFSSDAGFVAKFRREAQAVGALNHPNIVGVFDVGEQGGMYYIVMELVEGINLKKYIEKVGAMDEREAVEVAMQVAKGLEAAHDQGIIHRDIKPQNIIISREGKIKVADFGIARMVSTETSTTSTMGSVHYISPEQARGEACDARSDIYSLGITLFEMLSGQVPFDGNSSVTVALKHVKEELPAPRALVPTITRNAERIVQKCTQKSPGLRYRSMSDLLVDFRKLIVMPDEDFVVLPVAGDNDPSLAMRKEDSDILKVAGIAPGRKNYENEEKAAQAYEEGVSKAIGLQEEDRLAEEKAKRTERLLNYIMLGIGVLILAAIIAIVFKACALLTPPSSTTTAYVPETVNTTARPSTAPRESTTVAPTTGPTEPSSTQPTTSAEATIPPGTVVLRDFVGMDYASAMEALLNDGFRIRLEYELLPEGSPIENNTVVDQSFEAGVPLLYGTEVTIWIGTRNNGTVVIPTTIVGKSAEDAGNILREMGLVVSSGTEWENSSTVEQGKVMGSNPPVGSLAERGTPITLIISNGPAMFRMPSLLGYTREQAVAALAATGFSTSTNLVIRKDTVSSDTYLPNTVALVEASTNGYLRAVYAGESVDLNSVVYLTFTDPEPVLPQLLGREDVEAAVEELQRLGLQVTQKRELSQTYPVGQICWVTEKDGKTDIPEGKTLKKGDEVMLHISAHAVPADMIGLSVEEVTAILEESGIPYKFENDKKPKDAAKAWVKSLTPKEGTVLEQDEAIVISFDTTAASSEAPTTEAPTTEAPTTEAPTTEAPTTEAPTTETPTTEAPTTEAPTTEAPTTEAPTTQAPTTEAPTTQAPTTEPQASTVTIPVGVVGKPLQEALNMLEAADPTKKDLTWNYVVDGKENNNIDKSLYKVKNLWTNGAMNGSPITEGALLTLPIVIWIECEENN